MATDPVSGEKEEVGQTSAETAADPEPETELSQECSECGTQAKFYSIYEKRKAAFCSTVCHAKRNEKEATPNLMLVQIDTQEGGRENKLEDEPGVSGQQTDEVIADGMEGDIFEACHGGLSNNKILYKLLEGGADLHRRDANDQPLLVYAATNGDVTTLKLLLEKGVDINQKGKGQATPLMIAAELGAKEKVSFLLSKDADTNLKDADGKTALHRTERNRVIKCAELLIEKNPDLLQATDNCQQTVLHQAAGEGNKNLVKFLLDSGTDIAALDNLLRSALHWSIIQGMDTVVGSLLERDSSKVLDEPDRFGVRPIHYAIQSNRLDIAELLIDKGCELEAGESRGLTALIYAAACGKRDLLSLMIPRCKDINIADSAGWTALHHAAKRGDDAVCKHLLDHQADPNVPDGKQKQTPIFVAVGNRHVGIVKLLLERDRESSRVKDEQGRLALHYAAEHGQLDIVSALLESEDTTNNGKDTRNSPPTNSINAKDNLGHTALYLSARNSHKPCCKLLMQRRAEVDELSRELLFELGLIGPEAQDEKEGTKEEEEKQDVKEEERNSLSSRERYGVEDTEVTNEKMEDLDLGPLADTNAIALNSRYIYDGLGPPPKSTPRRTNSTSKVIPRRVPGSSDRQDSFNLHWKVLLTNKRKTETNLKTRKGRDYLKSPYAQPLVSDEVLRKYNLKVLHPTLNNRSAGRSADVPKKSPSVAGEGTSADEENGDRRSGALGNRSIGSKSTVPLNPRTGSSYSDPKRFTYSVVSR